MSSPSAASCVIKYLLDSERVLHEHLLPVSLPVQPYSVLQSHMSVAIPVHMTEARERKAGTQGKGAKKAWSHDVNVGSRLSHALVARVTETTARVSICLQQTPTDFLFPSSCNKHPNNQRSASKPSRTLNTHIQPTHHSNQVNDYHQDV
jgi:hypothetical protein